MPDSSKEVRAVFTEVTLEEMLEVASEPSRYMVDCSGRWDSQSKGPETDVGLPGACERQQGGQHDCCRLSSSGWKIRRNGGFAGRVKDRSFHWE